MEVLILGSPRFVGRHMVEAASRHGHEVSVFNRGRTAPDIFDARVESLAGDRDGDLAALERGTWNAVVDASAYPPRVVGALARLLSGRVTRYAFVSTASVYRFPVAPGTDEGGPVRDLAAPAVPTPGAASRERRLPDRASSNLPHNSWDHEMAHTDTLGHPLRPGPSR